MVARLHNAYETHALSDRLSKKDSYLRDPHEALFLIFSFSFYQGRRDSVSEKFRTLAEETCRKYLAEHENLLHIPARRTNKKEVLTSEYAELATLLHNNGLNKKGDRLMVVSLINFIQSSQERNILRYILHAIESGKLSQVYRELDGIWSVGPKIASLILRDIVYIYRLEDHIEGAESYSYLQPVDTWVHQVAQKLNMVNSTKKDPYHGEARDITEKCLETGVNPIHFNQGAWFLGSRSLDILLRNLHRIEVEGGAN